ncbi:MAG: hypothetical protein KF745_05850 [Phycisphaeraceae bacterium]|nr:hypothetical protein [Phycisphaeraceae bacterium]
MRKLPAISTLAVLGASSLAFGSVSFSSLESASTEGLGRFTGELKYTPGSETSGLLSVMLTNTSPAANGGFITGFVFDIPSSDLNAGASLSSADFPFTQLTGPNAAPFGTYDAGAAIGGNFLGGGNPHPGIGVGQTGLFQFQITGSDAGQLTESSFLTAGAPYGFIVRFRGFENGGSDKVPAVPAPGAGALLAAAALLAHRRRR